MIIAKVVEMSINKNKMGPSSQNYTNLDDVYLHIQNGC